MKNFIKNNWFRLSILFITVITCFFVFSYFKAKNQREGLMILENQNRQIIEDAYKKDVEKRDYSAKQKQAEDSVSQLTTIDWNKPFDKNVELENLYKSSSQWPANHTICIPIKKFYCDGNSCENVEPKVFNLIGGDRDNPKIYRCDRNGCDAYDSIIEDSGEYKNIQPVYPKGFIFKMSYNTIDKKYVEVTTLGLDTFISYGYCAYSTEKL
ncbi:hypothetical protein H0W91_03290 [Patescibacteria group bacterium]|nr:hypothetical protein [Patescibacteria group bacterium]